MLCRPLLREYVRCAPDSCRRRDGMTDLDARVRALEASVKELQDREHILRTLYQYCHNLDRAEEPAGMMDCFVEDGVWRSTVGSKTAGIAGARVEGRTAIGEW